MRTAAPLLLLLAALSSPPGVAAGGREYVVRRANADAMGFPVRVECDVATAACQVNFPAEVRRADGSVAVLSRAELAVGQPLVEADLVTRELPGATARRGASFRLDRTLLPRASLRLYFRYPLLDEADLFSLDLGDLAGRGPAVPLENPHER